MSCPRCNDERLHWVAPDPQSTTQFNPFWQLRLEDDRENVHFCPFCGWDLALDPAAAPTFIVPEKAISEEGLTRMMKAERGKLTVLQGGMQAVRPLAWTREKPSKPGFYFMRVLGLTTFTRLIEVSREFWGNTEEGLALLIVDGSGTEQAIPGFGDESERWFYGPLPID